MIITNNEELLRRPCEKVLPEEISSIIESLENELNYTNKIGRPGIGLAAPQIGITKTAAIIRIDNTKIDLINPIIEKGYDLKPFKEEGCLSFPGKVEDTMRYQEIVVNNNGKRFIATGLIAIACQHEIDHISSILFFDRKIEKPKFKLKPNDLCLCGKYTPAKKYKKCCGK